MGKLACQLCIGAAAISLIIQIVAICRPLYEVGSVSPLGGFFGYGLFHSHIYWNKIQIRTKQVKYWQGILSGDVLRSNKQKAEKRGKKDAAAAIRNSDEGIEDEANATGLTGPAKSDYIKQRKLEQVFIAEWNAYFKTELDQYWCDSSRKLKCYDLPLSSLATFFGNTLMQRTTPLLPGLPGVGQSSFVMFWTGWAIVIFNAFSIIALGMGGGYLYYYSEIKASKNARKGAMMTLTAAPMLSLLLVLALLAVVIFVGGQVGSTSFLSMFAASSSGAFPKEGFGLFLFNMIFMSMSLCYSRQWRMKRAERVRKQKKDEEEEEEFMQLMGIDRSKLDEESEEETSDEESSDEEEPEDEERPRAQKPAIVQSAPPMNTFPGSVVTYPVGQSYTTQTYTIPAQQPQVTTQRIVIDPNQPGTQRIML